MIPSSFEYVRPSSVSEAVTALRDAGDEGKVLSGGQSLLPLLRLRVSYPEALVDIGEIPGLHGVRGDGSSLLVGASTTHDEVMRDPLMREHCPPLAAATSTVAA